MAKVAPTFLLAFLPAVILALRPALAADCIDYQDYLHLVTGMDTPGFCDGVVVQGTLAYLADGEAGLSVADIQTPENPTPIGRIDTPDYAVDLALVGHHALVADRGAGLQVVDITVPTAPVVVGHLDTPGTARDVAVVGDLALVADGEAGLEIIDIGDPSAPRLIGGMDTPGDARAVALAGSMAFIADGDAGLLIIDITDPQRLTPIGTVDTPGFANDVAVSASHAWVSDGDEGVHSVSYDPLHLVLDGSTAAAGDAYAVAVAGDYAYLAVSDRGLCALDISDPHAPVIVGEIDTPGFATGIAISAANAYVADGHSGLQVAGVANPASPPLLGRLPLGDPVRAVAADGSLAFVANDYSGLRVVDISTPEAPVVVGSVRTQQTMDVAIHDSLAYVVAMYGGLHVVDVSAPSMPQVIAEVALPPYGFAVDAAGSFVYAVTEQEGPGMTPRSFHLWVVDVSTPSAPIIVGQLTSSGYCRDIVVSDSVAYLRTSNETSYEITVVEVSDPYNPRIVNSVSQHSPGGAIALTSSQRLVAIDHVVFRVFDLSIPSAPQAVGSLEMPGVHTGVAVSRSSAYVADKAWGLRVVDIRDPAAPVLIGSIHTNYLADAVAASDEGVCMGENFMTGGRYAGTMAIYPVQCSGVSPVLVSDFTWALEEGAIVLTWRTTFETEFVGFHVERSTPPCEAYERMTDEIIPAGGLYRFRDDRVAPGSDYCYRLVAVDRSGREERSEPIAASFELAVSAPHVALVPCHPNPFRMGHSPLTISFRLRDARRVSLHILDPAGRVVRDLVDGEFVAGSHTTDWDGRNEQGVPVPSGVYFYELRVDGTVLSGRVTALR